MKNIILLITIMVIALSAVQAQQVQTYNLYNNNRYLVNPAKTGSEGELAALLDARNQWAGFEGAPRTTTFGVHGSMLENMGLGLLIRSDKRGIFESMSAAINYSYSIKITNDQKLTFGASAGALQNNFSQSKVSGNSIDFNDPALFDGYMDKLQFEGGAGFVYNYSGFELAVSSPRLFSLNQHFIGIASYDFRLSDEKWLVQPAFAYQVFPESPDQWDAMLLTSWNNSIWLQGTYRSTGNIVVGLGAYLKQMGIGYAYEINSGQLSQFSQGTHEVVVSFNFGENLRDYKSKNRNQRTELMEKERKNEREMTDLQEKVKKLEQELELEKKIRELEKEIEELKKREKETFVEPEDSVVETTDVVVELDKNVDRGTTDVETDKDGFTIARGNYVVISTVNNPASAKKLKKMFAEKGVTASVAHNPGKGYYYIYTHYSTDLDEALEMMQKQRDAGFEKAWVCVFK